jgi:hypothetical protein
MFQKTRNKYGAKKTTCSLGHPHPSQLEASVCEVLILRQRAGEIRELKYQATVHLAFGIKWKVDWEFEQRCKVTISGVCTETWWQMFAEAKGAETRDYRLKKRMWKEGCGPAPLEIWKGTAKRPVLVETVYPKEKGEV